MLIKYKNIPLSEASETRDFMTRDEKILKRKLINLLKDDGQGHHHAKYAACLKNFIVQIVPLGKEPSTAAISFNDGIIYINQGFLRDPTTFGQLNVIMRHELCHNLLMHQIRMIKHLQDIIPEESINTSRSLNELLNIIMDFEISNKKYSKEDKEVVRHTWLNGKLISGLVTEDHRQNWATMPLEQMYDAFMTELESLPGITGSQLPGWENSNTLNAAAARLRSYRNVKAVAQFDTVEELQQALLPHKKDEKIDLPANIQKIFDGLKTIIDDPDIGYTDADIDEMLNAIAKSTAISKVDLISPQTKEILATVYSPEEKAIAAEILKIYKGDTTYQQDYNNWYAEIMKKLAQSGYTDAEIQALLDCIK